MSLYVMTVDEAVECETNCDCPDPVASDTISPSGEQPNRPTSLALAMLTALKYLLYKPCMETQGFFNSKSL